MNNRSSYSVFSTVILSTLLACPTSVAFADDGDSGSGASCSFGAGDRQGMCASASDKGVNAGIWSDENSSDPERPASGPVTTAGDDTTRQSNEATPASEAGAYFDFAHCALESNPFGDDPFTHGSWVCAYPPPEPGQDAPQNRPPTTRELLLAAATLIHPDGAGLRKRPEGVSYTNRRIPTLVNVTHPTQTHTVTLLGRDVTVTLTAQEYTWDWGDDTPNTVTSSPGAAWEEGMDPNTDPTLIRHYYTAPGGWKSFLDGPYPKATRTITLTTTWAGTATNPFTGDTQTINGLVTTTETTDPFRLDHLIINNTDTSEEKQGH